MTNKDPIGKLFMLLAAICLLSCNGGAEQSAPPPDGGALKTDGALIAQYSEAAADTFPPPPADSILVLDWLREATAAEGIVMETREFAFGSLVRRIGHRVNGDDGYWLYKVNAAMVPKAVSEHRVARSDTVLFFFDER